jgi:hypothetical protein
MELTSGPPYAFMPWTGTPLPLPLAHLQSITKQNGTKVYCSVRNWSERKCVVPTATPFIGADTPPWRLTLELALLIFCYSVGIPLRKTIRLTAVKQNET